MQPMYLVTGAAGHLGNTVVQQLRAQGKPVRALVLPQEADAARRRLPTGTEIVPGDVCDEESLAPFFANAEGRPLIVIHAAGIVSITSKYNPLLYAVNVCGTRNIVKLCQAHAVQKLIYVSSVHALPELPKGQVICEIGPAGFSPDAVRGAYAKTKAEATRIVLDAVREGLCACIVHPSGILGPFDYGRGHGTQMVLDYLEGRLLAGVRGGYDFVDVRDVAAGILACSEKGARGACYLLSNRFLAVEELLEDLHQLTGLPRVKAMMPLWFIRMMAPFAEAYYRLRRQPPLFTRYSLYTLQSNSAFCHEKAAKELGFCPRPLMETLRDTVRWLTDQGRVTPPRPRRALKRRVAAT